MRAGDLYVERFPEDLRRDGKIAALRRGETFREFVIAAVAAHVAAQVAHTPVGQAPEAAPASSPRVSKRP